MVRSEMEVVLRCENDVQFDALTVVDFTMLYLMTLDYLTKSPVSIAGTNREKAAFLYSCVQWDESAKKRTSQVIFK